jgi:hypothetical protein
MKESPSESSPLSNLPKALKPEDRLVLEMLVVDEDLAEAQTFLIEHGIAIVGKDDPLGICKGWFREIRRGERGKLQIRFTDKGPTMDINA